MARTIEVKIVGRLTLEERAKRQGLYYVAVSRQFVDEIYKQEWHEPVEFRFTPDASGDPLLVSLEMRKPELR